MNWPFKAISCGKIVKGNDEGTASLYNQPYLKRDLTMSTLPMVGIVVCTYNRPEQLRTALCTIQRQTYENTVVVVVDDGSHRSEENLSVTRAFGARINYIYNTTNLGIAKTRNIGLRYLLQEVGPQLICMLDDDDHWPNNRVELGVQAMQPGVGMSYGIQCMADENLQPIMQYPCQVSYQQARWHALLFGEFFFLQRHTCFMQNF